MFRLPVLLLCLLPASVLARPLVLIVGDSISAGFGVPLEEQWPLIMEDSLQQEFPELSVVAAAISGDTTSGGRSRLPQLLEEYSPDVVVIGLGGNDALRGTPLSVIGTNLEAMASAARTAGARVVVAGMQIPPNYGPAYTSRFRALYPEVANNTGSGLIPFLLEGVATVEGMMQDDGIHPTAAAQPVVAELVTRAVTEQLRAAE